jgi:hypothetical protein
MVVAFLRDYFENHGLETNLGKLILEMCNFYGNIFDHQEQGISVYGERYDLLLLAL